MTSLIRESINLKHEKWRIFNLLREKLERLPEVLPGINRSISIRRISLSNGEGISEWTIRDDKLNVCWKQREKFLASGQTIALQLVSSEELSCLRGAINLINGDQAETQLEVALSLGWQNHVLRHMTSDLLEKRAGFAVRHLLREMKHNEHRGRLKEIFGELGSAYLCDFFGIAIPEHIRKNLQDQRILGSLNRQQIMSTVAFRPPFLKIQKLIVAGKNDCSSVQTTSLGTGIVTQNDTKGHYNETIFLALCGWLMASSASVHLAFLYPGNAPQVVEANGVKPISLSSMDGKLWKPSKQGTPFFVETNVLRKKLQLAVVSSRISFGNIPYGVIDELKLMLTPSNSIVSATEFPSL